MPCLSKTVWQLDLNPKASLLKETSSLPSVFHIFSPSLHCKSLFSFALLKQHRTDWPEYEYEYEYSNCEETQHNLPWFYSPQQKYTTQQTLPLFSSAIKEEFVNVNENVCILLFIIIHKTFLDLSSKNRSAAFS